jgi:hypothetical protein
MLLKTNKLIYYNNNNFYLTIRQLHFLFSLFLIFYTNKSFNIKTTRKKTHFWQKHSRVKYLFFKSFKTLMKQKVYYLHR